MDEADLTAEAVHLPYLTVGGGAEVRLSRASLPDLLLSEIQEE